MFKINKYQHKLVRMNTNNKYIKIRNYISLKVQSN